VKFALYGDAAAVGAVNEVPISTNRASVLDPPKVTLGPTVGLDFEELMIVLAVS
jgi:hypothetical protein